MVTYRQRRASHAWIVGIIIFILAMTITFADVYGLDRFEYSSEGGTTGSNLEAALDDWQNLPIASQDASYDPNLPCVMEVPAVPEPASLTLLALGCGALLAARKKAKF